MGMSARRRIGADFNLPIHVDADPEVGGSKIDSNSRGCRYILEVVLSVRNEENVHPLSQVLTLTPCQHQLAALECDSFRRSVTLPQFFGF